MSPAASLMFPVVLNIFARPIANRPQDTILPYNYLASTSTVNDPGFMVRVGRLPSAAGVSS
jgi:hypothetical protein